MKTAKSMKKKGLACVAAAAIAAGGIGLVSPDHGYAEEQQQQKDQQTDQQKGQQNQAQNQPQEGAARQAGDSQRQQDQRPAGARKRAQEPNSFVLIVPVPVARPVPAVPASTLAPDIEDIRDTLASATEAALTKGGFDDLMERFVDADRNRMAQSGLDDKELETLDGRIAQIRKAWKDRYGSEFDIDDEAAVFGPFPVVQGEISENAPRLAAGELGVANEAAGNDPEDVNLEPGRDVALVTVPPGQGMRELSLLMVHEFPDAWKIDVPDSVSARDLHDNLLKHLTAFGEATGNWPANEQEAYRRVAHHVLSAVSGFDAHANQPE